MQIRVFSDVHLEFGDCFLPMGGDVIVAAGDISPGTRGVDWLGQSDVPVIYVAGNHEYYGGDFSDTQRDIRRRAENYRNLHFLECSSVVLGGVRFLGTTLWTSFEKLNPRERSLVRAQVNDYFCIYKDGRYLQPDDTEAIHHSSLAWLRGELERGFDGRTVVVSHHAPSMQSWHHSPLDVARYAYCNELEELTKTFPLDLWIHGHTHATQNYRLHNTQVLCNPRGYYMRETMKKELADCLVEV